MTWCLAIVTSAPLPISSCSSVKVPMASFVAIKPAALGWTPSSVWAKMTPLCVGAPPTMIAHTRQDKRGAPLITQGLGRHRLALLLAFLLVIEHGDRLGRQLL